jgi:hypothetical protein
MNQNLLKPEGTLGVPAGSEASFQQALSKSSVAQERELLSYGCTLWLLEKPI